MATLLFRKTRAEVAGDARTAIIDIGSNSIRLVVYQGPARLPAILFNEKVLAGLGRGIAANGRIDDKAMAAALDALARFSTLAREMDVSRLSVVATAAVRDAANGQDLLDRVRAIGLPVQLLSGDQEAIAAGH
ncbi:MAG: Ppx/GppA family phosphatase, partial [Sphingomonas sp.]